MRQGHEEDPRRYPYQATLLRSLMQQYRLCIPNGMTVQKDTYRIRGPDGDKFYDAWEFEAASAKEAAVQWFKRLKTSIQVDGEGKTSTAEFIVDMRSHHVGCYAPQCQTDKPLPAPTMGLLLAAAVARFAHGPLPVRRVLHQTDKKIFLLAVHDPMWWAGTIHKLAEFDSMQIRYPLDEKANTRFASGELVRIGPNL